MEDKVRIIFNNGLEIEATMNANKSISIIEERGK